MKHIIAEFPIGTPNRFPWQIEVLLCGSKGRDVFTTDLFERYGHPEIELRAMHPQTACAVLDRIAAWIVFEGNQVFPDDILVYEGIEYVIVLTVNQQGNPTFRLSWAEDLKPNHDDLIGEFVRFGKALLEHKCCD